MYFHSIDYIILFPLLCQIDVSSVAPIRGYTIRGVAVKATLAHLYSQGVMLPLFPKGRKQTSRPVKKSKCSKDHLPVDLSDIIEIRDAAKAKAGHRWGGMEDRRGFPVWVTYVS